MGVAMRETVRVRGPGFIDTKPPHITFQAGG